MKRLLLGLSLLGSCITYASTPPLQVGEVSLKTSDCTANPAQNAAIGIVVTGGVAPYTFSLPGFPDQTSAGGSASFNAIPANTQSAVITVTDSATPVPNTTQVSVSPVQTLAATVTISPQICNQINLVLNIVRAGGIQGSISSISLTGSTGFSKKITAADLIDDAFTFEGLKLGKYTLIITPEAPAGSPTSCSNPVTLLFEIATPVLAASSVVNTKVSNGGKDGALQVKVVGGFLPYTLRLTGPVPSKDVIALEILGDTGIFTGLAGGFYTLSITDGSFCTVTQPVVVNIFADPAANRIALAYC